MSETGMRQLAVGLTHSRSVKVTDDMTPAHLRSEPIRVLSTPDMIRLIEQTAIEAVAPCLAPGQATVGTRVDVAHLAATPVGMTVTITVELVGLDLSQHSETAYVLGGSSYGEYSVGAGSGAFGEAMRAAEAKARSTH